MHRAKKTLPCLRNLSFLLEMQRLPRFSLAQSELPPGFLCIKKAVSAPAAAAGLGTKPRSLHEQLVRTVRGGEPMGGPFARLQHGSWPSSWLSSSWRKGGRGLKTWAWESILHGLPHVAHASRAGSLPPEECGERLG